MDVITDFYGNEEKSEEFKFEVTESDYKAKIENETNSLNMTFEILRYGDKDMFVIEFLRNSGSLNDFHQ